MLPFFTPPDARWDHGRQADYLHTWATEHFLWISDQIWRGMPEHWPTRAEVIEGLTVGGGVFRDDCDGRAMMLVYACRDIGLPCMAMYCLVDGAGHLNAIISKRFVSDNLQRAIAHQDELLGQGYVFVSMGPDPDGLWWPVKGGMLA